MKLSGPSSSFDLHCFRESLSSLDREIDALERLLDTLPQNSPEWDDTIAKIGDLMEAGAEMNRELPSYNS